MRHGELDHPEAAYQPEPDLRPSDPTYLRVLGIVVGIGLGAALALHFALRLFGGPR